MSELADVIAKKLSVTPHMAEGVLEKARVAIDEGKSCVLEGCDQAPSLIMFLAGYLETGGGGAFVGWPVCEAHEEAQQDIANGLFQAFPNVVSIGVKKVPVGEVLSAG